MTTRALTLAGDIRCLVTGAAALALGAVAFVVTAVFAVAMPAVSGAWLVLPCLVMVVGVAALVAWLVFGQGARRLDPAPLPDQPWRWIAEQR